VSGDFEGKARVMCAKENNGTHRILDSAVHFRPGEEVPHLSSGTAPRRATCHRIICRTAPRRGIPVGSRTQKANG